MELRYIPFRKMNGLGNDFVVIDARAEPLRLSAAAADPAGRRGLVHFCWVPDADARIAAMTAYLAALSGHRA